MEIESDDKKKLQREMRRKRKREGGRVPNDERERELRGKSDKIHVFTNKIWNGYQWIPIRSNPEIRMWICTTMNTDRYA